MRSDRTEAEDRFLKDLETLYTQGQEALVSYEARVKRVVEEYRYAGMGSIEANGLEHTYIKEVSPASQSLQKKFEKLQSIPPGVDRDKQFSEFKENVQLCLTRLKEVRGRIAENVEQAAAKENELNGVIENYKKIQKNKKQEEIREIKADIDDLYKKGRQIIDEEEKRAPRAAQDLYSLTHSKFDSTVDRMEQLVGREQKLIGKMNAALTDNERQTLERRLQENRSKFSRLAAKVGIDKSQVELDKARAELKELRTTAERELKTSALESFVRAQQDIFDTNFIQKKIMLGQIQEKLEETVGSTITSYEKLAEQYPEKKQECDEINTAMAFELTELLRKSNETIDTLHTVVTAPLHRVENPANTREIHKKRQDTVKAGLDEVIKQLTNHFDKVNAERTALEEIVKPKLEARSRLVKEIVEHDVVIKKYYQNLVVLAASTPEKASQYRDEIKLLPENPSGFNTNTSTAKLDEMLEEKKQFVRQLKLEIIRTIRSKLEKVEDRFEAIGSSLTDKEIQEHRQELNRLQGSGKKNNDFTAFIQYVDKLESMTRFRSTREDSNLSKAISGLIEYQKKEYQEKGEEQFSFDFPPGRQRSSKGKFDDILTAAISLKKTMNEVKFDENNHAEISSQQKSKIIKAISDVEKLFRRIPKLKPEEEEEVSLVQNLRGGLYEVRSDVFNSQPKNAKVLGAGPPEVKSEVLSVKDHKVLLGASSQQRVLEQSAPEPKVVVVKKSKKVHRRNVDYLPTIKEERTNMSRSGTSFVLSRLRESPVSATVSPQKVEEKSSPPPSTPTTSSRKDEEVSVHVRKEGSPSPPRKLGR